MNIIEVKNNLVKIGYSPSQEELILSGFLAIKDETSDNGNAFIGQIMHLEAKEKSHFAIVKLLFNYNEEGVITNYNGAIPGLNSAVSYVATQNILELLPVQNPVVIGEIAQQQVVLKLDETLFKGKLLVCCEKEEDKKLLIKNINAQLTKTGKKVLVIDLLGTYDFSSNSLVASEDFKLPLNYEAINFIYEKGIETNVAETKALIQEVFLEVQEYVKTIDDGFIPFESFKNVVDEQYQELGLVELVLLKNKLLKYYDEGVFAQSKNQFECLSESLRKRETTILDLSKVEEKIQREIILYAYALISESQEDVYVLLNVNNSNSDKKLLKKIYTSNNAFSTVICPYSYKYLIELKQLAKDLILFSPINQQNDFASYNTFFNKLNPDEFIIYGDSTHNIPLIVKLDESPQQVGEGLLVSEAEVAEAAPMAHSPIEFMEVSDEEALDAQIRQDVDQFYTSPSNEASQSAQDENDLELDALNWQEETSDSFDVELLEEDLTENDLDFIDDLNIGQENVYENAQVVAQEFHQEPLQEALHEEELLQETPEYQPTQEPLFEEGFQINAGEAVDDDLDDAFFGDLTEAPVEVISKPSFEQELHEASSQEGSFEMPTGAGFAEFSEEEPPAVDILPASEAFIPSLPIYSAEVDKDSTFDPDQFEQGDIVTHAKYGKGTVEKLISYGAKTLCSIHFDNVGRRLLDPSLAEIKKV